MHHRAVSRKYKVLSATIALVFALLHQSQVRAEVQVELDLADQLPPLAHVDHSYNWQFSAETFKSDQNVNDLQYEVKGLPSWARFDAGERRITGKPSKSGRGDDVQSVSVLARDGESEASSSFRLTTISAPPPKLNISLQDQLPQAASMGEGNMLADKVLHMPLGWSFSIGFLGNTYYLPDNDRVYYSSHLVGGEPLPDWLNFNPDEITFSGIAPTSAGRHGTKFDIELIASNRRGAGGPSSSFSILLGEGFVTLNNTAAQLPIANVTEGEELAYHIPQRLFLLDGFSQSPEQFSFKLGADTPDWIKMDNDAHNLTGRVPFDAKNTHMRNTTVEVQVMHPRAFDTDVNVTLHVYPSPFTMENLPNVTVQTGKDFRVSLEKYLRDSNIGMNVSFDSGIMRRSLHARHPRHRHHRMVRRAAPSWLHFDDKSHSLVGQAPDSEQDITVHLSAAHPDAANVPIPPAMKAFQLIVHNTTHVNQTDTDNGGGLTGGEKGAIAGSILGAALLALLGAGGYFAWKRWQKHAPASETGDDAPQDLDSDTYETPPATRETPPHNLSDIGVSGENDSARFHETGAGMAGTGVASAAAAAGLAGTTATSGTGAVRFETAQAEPAPASEPPRHTPPPSGSTRGAASAPEHTTMRTARPHEERPSMTQNLPYEEPEWQRDDDQFVVTPFLAQTAWQPPMFTQMWGSNRTRHDSTDTETHRPPHNPIRQPSMTSISQTPMSAKTPTDNQSFSTAQTPSKGLPKTMGLLTYGLAGEGEAAQASRPLEQVVEEGTNSTNAPDMSNLSEHDIPKPASFLMEMEEAEVTSSTETDHDTTARKVPQQMPVSYSKQSQESWEENLWYDKPTPPSKRASVASVMGASSQAFEGGEDDNVTRAPKRASTIKRVDSKRRRSSAPLSPPIDATTFDDTPQLAPILSSVVRSPIVPSLGETPRLSVDMESGKMSPLDSFVPPPTQPMEEVGRTRHVPLYTPQLERGASDRRSESLHAEQIETAAMFEDADEPNPDPFDHVNAYPYGTVLNQSRAPDSPVATDSESTNHLDEFLSTEGGMYSVIQGEEFSQETDVQNRTFGPPPRSSTMASIQMAQTRSVNFTPAKPPRLQLVSCRPGEALSLPLITSDASFPRNLASAIENASSPAQYVPQLFAPLRPDLHGTWPTWLAWLEWKSDTQELAGTVPDAWPPEQRLPLQLPIHIVLSNGTQILAENGVSRREMPEPGTPFLAARILLTILPAAEAQAPFS